MTVNIFLIRLIKSICTLASQINVGQGMNVGPGEFGKKNKHRALNTHVRNNHQNNLYVLSHKAAGP